MAQEDQVGGQVDGSQAEAPQSAEPSPVETSARELGWVPKEEYEGDETRWLDAGEFVRRQPLFEKIEKQNRELKEIKRTVAQFAQHHAKVRETEYQRAIANLEAQKVAAFEDGDAKQVVKIDSELRVVEKAKDQFVAEQTGQAQREAQSVHPEFEAWTNRNPWYTSDRAMRAYADALGTDIAQRGRPDGSNLTPEEVLKQVEKKVREEFPKRFTNTNRDKPGAVESASSKGGTSYDGYTPTDTERQIAKRFVKQGAFPNEAAYYKELKSLNGKS